MKRIDNHLPTVDLQRLDAAHHMHPFTKGDELNAKGARVITKASGVMLTDSEGIEILDGMAGLWCVNLGYGRSELAQAAAAQMDQLPYYNTFFQTTHPPVVALSSRIAELTTRGHEPHVFRLFWVRSQRHKYSPCAPILGADGQARQKGDH